MSSDNPKTILLVDDEVIISMAASKTLQKLGYKVVTANTGEKAVETASTNKEINLILMDIDLGKGIDGTQAAAIILKENDIPVVFHSSHTEPEVVEKTEKITSYGYVVKNSGATVIDASIKMAFKLFNAYKSLSNELAERKKVENDLKLKSLVLDQIKDHVTITDLKGVINYVNQAQTETFGHLKEKLSGQTTEIFGENVKKGVTQKEIAEKTLEKGEWRGEIINYGIDGSEHIMDCRTNVIYDDNNSPIVLCGISTDITERKQSAVKIQRQKEELVAANEELNAVLEELQSVNDQLQIQNEELQHTGETLRESEERYRSLLQHLEAGVVVHAEDTSIIRNNARAAELLGLSDDQLKGKKAIDPAWKFVYADSTPLPLSEYPVNRIVRDKKPIKAQIMGVYQPGENTFVWLMVNGFPVFDKTSGIAEIVISFIDITESKRLEEALKISERQYRLIFEKIHDGFYYAEAVISDNGKPVDFRFLDVNPACERFFNLPRKDIVGKTYKSIRGERVSSEWIDILCKVALTGDPISVERYAPVSRHWVQLNAYPIDSLKFAVVFTDITERKQAEDVLRQNEQRFRSLHENATVGIALSFMNEQEVIINPALSEILGIETGRTNLDELVEMTHPDDIEKEMPLFLELKEGRLDSYTIEKRYIRKDGMIIWGRLSMKIVHDDAGNPWYTMALVEDITERKRTEDALKESEFKYRTLIESSTDVIFCVNQNGEYQFTNQVFASTFGKTPDYFIGKSFWDVYPKEHADQRQKANKRMFETGQSQSVEVEVPLPESTLYFLAKANPIKDKTGKVILNLTTATDITERKHMEKQLIESEEIYRSYIEYSPIGVFICNENGHYTQVNPAATAITGYSQNELLSMSIPDLLPPESQVYAAKLFQAVSETGSTSAEFAFKHKNGQIRMWSLEGVKLSAIRFMGLCVDITERIKNEETIKSLLTEKELILKEVHHRLKNNMNTVHGLLTLQADNIKDSQAISILEDAANRIRSMVVLYDKLYRSDNVQDISVKDYLSSLVHEIIANFPNSKSVKVNKKIDDFALDVKRLQSLGIIINELITNIMKYAFTGRDNGLITISASLKGTQARFEIADNGLGIPESFNFENLTGFGLQLVRLLTKELHGTINIKRRKGTKFILEFDI